MATTFTESRSKKREISNDDLTDPIDFFRHFVTVHDTWLYCNAPDFPKEGQDAFFVIFWELKGIFLMDYQANGQTINRTYYATLKVKFAIIVPSCVSTTLFIRSNPSTRKPNLHQSLWCEEI